MAAGLVAACGLQLTFHRLSPRKQAEAIVAAHAAGRIHQDLVPLAWSYAHMSCNRFGIDPTPEAILRYFMHRLYLDGGGIAERS